MKQVKDVRLVPGARRNVLMGTRLRNMLMGTRLRNVLTGTRLRNVLTGTAEECANGNEAEEWE